MRLGRVILISIVLLIYSYVAYQLTGWADLSPWMTVSVLVGLLIVFGFVLSLPFYFWTLHHKPMSEKQKSFFRWTHSAMAYLNFLIPIVVLRDLVGLVFGVILQYDLTFLYSGWSTVLILISPFVFGLWGSLIVGQGAHVVRREVKDSRLPEAFEGLRILQISDLHIGLFLKEGFIEKVVQKVRELKADLVVLTGDIVDGAADEFAHDIAKLGNLEAEHGVYFVSGNHEYYWGFQSIRREIEKAGIFSLVNQSAILKKGDSEFLVAGIPDPASRHFREEVPHFEKLAEEFRPDQYRMLLSHQPSVAEVSEKAGFHLQLSGHTHGGQFFPWNLLIGFFQKYSKGHFRIGALQLYVNQGTGYWGPALRIGTYCELTEIILSADKQSA